jgi:hypothetical protein
MSYGRYYNRNGNIGGSLLKLDHPLIIYTGDEESKEYLRNIRNDKIIIKVIPLEHLYFYQYKDQINENRKKFWPTRDERCKTEIHIVLLSKFWFMKQSMQENPFHTDYFSWMDFNLLTKAPHHSTNYTSDSVYEKLNIIFNQPRQKCTLCVIGYWDSTIYDDLRLFYSHYQYICAGLFYTIEAKMVDIINKIIDYAEYVTKEGYGHGEEHLWGHIIDQNEDCFTLTVGDYQDAIENYFKIQSNHPYVNWVLQQYQQQPKRLEKLLKNNL